MSTMPKGSKSECDWILRISYRLELYHRSLKTYVSFFALMKVPSFLKA